MRHKFQIINPKRHEHLKHSQNRYTEEGLNSLKYRIKQRKLYTGFTYLLVDIGKFNDFDNSIYSGTRLYTDNSIHIWILIILIVLAMKMKS